jgi:hypothetical protein
MPPLKLTGEGVDGADFSLQQSKTGEAGRLLRYCGVNSDGLAVSCVGLVPIFADRVTEWTVTEWTESTKWTESTETYGAKRSASTETYEAKRSALPMPSLRQ